MREGGREGGKKSRYEHKLWVPAAVVSNRSEGGGREGGREGG